MLYSFRSCLCLYSEEHRRLSFPSMYLLSTKSKKALKYLWICSSVFAPVTTSLPERKSKKTIFGERRRKTSPGNKLFSYEV